MSGTDRMNKANYHTGLRNASPGKQHARMVFGLSLAALLSGGALAETQLAYAQPAPYQTRSYLLGSRHNVLDANYGMLCYGGNTVFGYEDVGYECTNPDNQKLNFAGNVQVTELAVGYARRLWYLSSGDTLSTIHPQGSVTAASNTPAHLAGVGGAVENMWTVGFPYETTIFDGTFVYPNHLEVQMTDRSIWRLNSVGFLGNQRHVSEQWQMIRGPGEVDFAGSWWDSTNAVSYRMEIIRETTSGGDFWRTYYCQDVDGPCIPGSIAIPVEEVAAGFDPFSGHRRLSVSQESYIESKGLWSRVFFASYPSEFESTWVALNDWNDAVFHNNTWFPNVFFPLYEQGGYATFEYIAGSRGFDRFRAAESNVWGPAAPIGFYTGSYGQQHVILYNPPPDTLNVAPLPAWQDRSQTLEFWERGISQSMIRSFAFQVTGTPPDKPWQLLNDPWGGPIYEVPVGWHEIPSVPLDTFRLPATIQEEIALDVHVPAGASGWIGSIQLLGELRAAGLFGSYIGDIPLSGIPRGEWLEVSLTVPTELRNALMGNYPGSKISTFVNAGVPGIQVRGLRTKGSAYNDVRAAFSNEPRSDVTSFPLLDFEEEGGWLTTGGEEIQLKGFALSGEYVAQLETGGWTEIVSREFSTAEIPYLGQTLTLDVEVPPSLPNPYWAGALQAYLSCPSQGLWHSYIGQADLTHLFTNDWNTVEFGLPAHIRTALLSSATDCSFTVTLNVHQGVSVWRLDRMGFAD